jgi:hypothetical protein
MPIRGIDTDNYDDIITVSHFQMLHDVYGVVFNIIGLESRQQFAKSHQQNGYQAGIDNPFCYKFLYGAANDIERLKVAAGFGKPLAVDIEAELNMGVQANIQRMHEAKEALLQEGLFWGWYSSPNFWQVKTNNTMDFAGDKGWSATYPFNGLPPVNYLPDFSNFPSFGGLLNEVWQYSNKCYGDELGPWDLDMNAYEGPPVPAPVARQWLYGDERAGIEARGPQQVTWNNWIEVDILGDEAGLFPGQHWHNEGGIWKQVLP